MLHEETVDLTEGGERRRRDEPEEFEDRFWDVIPCRFEQDDRLWRLVVNVFAIE